jgi:hypothetical protein
MHIIIFIITKDHTRNTLNNTSRVFSYICLTLVSNLSLFEHSFID